MSEDPRAEAATDPRAASGGEGDPRVRDLEDRVRRLGDRLAVQAELDERHRAQIETLKARNREIQSSYASLRARRAVRLGRLLSGAIRRGRAFTARSAAVVRDGLGSVGIVPPGWHRLRASSADEARLREALRAALPPVHGASAARLGVVIIGAGVDPGRDARGEGRLREHLARSGAEITEVRSVDDAPGRLAEAVAGVRGDAVLLVSDTAEPIEDAWLLRLLAALDASGADAVGACIVHGRRAGPSVGRPDEAADLTVRHLGVRFEPADGMPRPRFVAWGEDPLAHVRGGLVDVAAADVCLLVRRTMLERVGIAASQRLGVGDVDLSLRIRAAGGRVVVATDVVLLDRGPAGGPAPAAEVVDRLARAWGPMLYRAALRDRLAGRRTWSTAPLRALLVPPDAAEGRWTPAGVDGLGRALADLGWRATTAHLAAGSTDAGPHADVVVLLDRPATDLGAAGRGAVVIQVASDAARPSGTTPPDDADIAVRVSNADGGAAAVSDEELAGRIVEALDAWAASPRVAIVVGAESVERASTWGDWFFAHALRRAFGRRGVPAIVAARGEAADARVARADVTLALFGSATHETRPGQLNLLWVISHPDRLTRSVCERFDLLFAASDRFALDLGRRLGRPVLALHQATDPDRFRPDPTGPRHRLLFIGNSRGVRRPILDDLQDTPHELAVYGRNWTPELLDPRRLCGEWIANHELARYYSSAEIVLSDHWPDMRDEGFIANRIYDATAAGAFVISDHLPEIDAEFVGGVVTYRDAADLRRLVDHFLSDPADRVAHAERARQAVLARHTFAARADAILEAVAPHLHERGLALPGLAAGGA